MLTHEFITKADLPLALAFHAMVCIEEVIYLFGGKNY